MRHRDSIFSCVAALAIRTHWSEKTILSLPLRRLYKYLELTSVA